MIILGGGLIKHHICNANLMVGAYSYTTVCFFTKRIYSCCYNVCRGGYVCIVWVLCGYWWGVCYVGRPWSVPCLCFTVMTRKTTVIRFRPDWSLPESHLLFLHRHPATQWTKLIGLPVSYTLASLVLCVFGHLSCPGAFGSTCKSFSGHYSARVYSRNGVAPSISIIIWCGMRVCVCVCANLWRRGSGI